MARGASFRAIDVHAHAHAIVPNWIHTNHRESKYVQSPPSNTNVKMKDG